MIRASPYGEALFLSRCIEWLINEKPDKLVGLSGIIEYWVKINWLLNLEAGV